jgi:hypothetical protein
MICKGVKPRARSTNVIRTWRNLFKGQSAVIHLHVRTEGTYICVLSSRANALGIRIECAPTGVALYFRLASNLCCQSSIFCERILTNVSLDGRKGEACQREKGRAADQRRSHGRDMLWKRGMNWRTANVIWKRYYIHPQGISLVVELMCDAGVSQ